VFAGLRTPWSRGRRLTAVIGGLVLAAGSAVGVGVAAQLGDAHAATDADSPQMASVLSQLAANATSAAGKVGPFAKDFIDITKVAPNRATATSGAAGTLTENCGTDQNNHHNSDNFIVTPGVDHGAAHVHDYVGNRTTTARSTDRSLAAGGTTCANGDRSTFYWPVLRIQKEANGKADNQQTADAPGNIGRVIEPASVTIRFGSGGASRVSPAPQFLRSITGDAKAATNGPANARPTWTCTGFTNRVTNKYPVCPRNSQVERIIDFPNCWDGKHLDSADHRAHLVFPKANGACPKATKAVPQLEYQLVYPVPAGSLFAVDGFAGQFHSPATDHGDWENVMTAAQMNAVVSCVNNGRKC